MQRRKKKREILCMFKRMFIFVQIIGTIKLTTTLIEPLFVEPKFNAYAEKR
jgi:hypothetical protein